MNWDFLKHIDWGEWTAIGTFVLAIATVWLAISTTIATREARDEFRKNRADSERQHQEGYRPIVVFKPDWENIPGRPPSIANGFIEALRESQDNTSPVAISLKAPIINIGPGPALNTTVQIITTRDLFKQPLLIKVSPLGATSETHMSNLSTKAHPAEPMDMIVLQGKLDEGWKIVMSYTDVFGNKYETIHTNDPSKPWSDFTSG